MPDAIVAPPHEVQRRAWECAFDLGQEHSSFFGGNAELWLWLLEMACQRDASSYTWADCGTLLRLHRIYRPVRQ